MKTKIFSLMLILAASVCVTSCSSDDDSFAYPMDQLYGKWKAIEVQVDDTWYDVTRWPYTRFGMDITFYEGGKYYGSGYFGTGSGTYKVSGKTIKTYVDGEIYATYTVVSLTENTAELIMEIDGDTLRIRAKKQY